MDQVTWSLINWGKEVYFIPSTLERKYLNGFKD